MRIIPTRIHGLLDYFVALILIALPWLLHFNGPNTATYVPVASGIITILYSVTTNYEWGAVKIISMPRHLTLDLLSGVLLAASPWIFDFSKYIYMPHFLLGILEIFVAATSDPVAYSRTDR